MRVILCQRIWQQDNRSDSLRSNSMFSFILAGAFPLILAGGLLYVTFVYLKQQKARERRVATQRDLPREQLLPHHYKSFVQIENKLWAATAESARAKWDTARIKLPAAELRLVREYVRGLQKDFEVGNRVFAVVIGNSPELRMLRQLEWLRIKIEFPYHMWHAWISFRLWMGQISPGELRRLTEIVSTLAYEIRRMLNVFEQGGHVDLVEYLLKES